MIYKRFDDKLVIRLLKGDKLVESIKKILEKENIRAGSISGIGATDKLDVSVFDPKSKEYNNVIYNEDLEITSLVGNISKKDKEVYTHLHIVCGRNDLSTISGHLNEADISLTAEIFVNIINEKIGRVFDKNLGINILDLS